MVHFVYLAFVVLILIFLLFKRQIIFMTLGGTFLIGFVFYEFSIIGGLQALFFSMAVAGRELFDIIVLIAVMVALLESMKSLNAEKYLISPFKILFINPKISFWILGLIMYVLSLIFWPTPATALVAAVLAPAAINKGLSPLACAVSINLFGHGMALSGDFVLQATSGLSEKSAGLERGMINQEVIILSIITGITAALLSYLFLKQDLKGNLQEELVKDQENRLKLSPAGLWKGKLLAVVVLLSFLFVIFTLYKFGLKGEEATSLLGGLAISLVFFASTLQEKENTIMTSLNLLKEGFIFSIQIFTPVIPIAGFFFLGSNKGTLILDESVSPLLLDLAKVFMDVIPTNTIFLVFGILFIGLVSGLDGSGFSGLALTANLANVVGMEAGVDVEPLIAIGQMGAIWCGGGTIISWAFGLLTTAGLLNVDPMKIAKLNFIPVISGLGFAALVSIFLLLT